SLPVERVTDEVLRCAWKELDALHRAGIAHGTVDGLRVLVDDNGAVAFDDFSAADASGEDYWRNRDDAAFLVLSAQRVGDERAIAAMVAAIGKDRAGAVIPVVQPAALPSALTRDVKHQGKALKALRGAMATATGVDDVPPLKIKRLSLVNIGMLAGVLLALAIAIPSLEGIDWASMQSEFENAVWAWVVLAFVLWPLIPSAWATALMGCVNKDLPFVPTVLTQIACSFLNLITPNGIGGTALQLDYLHKQDVPVASAGSAMVLSTGVGGAIQMILFLGAAAITSTAVETSSSSDSSGSTTLIVIAVVAALVGIVLAVPKIRGKVVPQVKRAATDIWSVIRNPRKALQLIGGDTAGNLIYPALLGLCLIAFHQHLDFAQLVVVQVGAGMVGNVAPVPGGIGVTEAALTGGLTAFGIPATPALAAVIVFRGITFAIPPIFGFVTLRWLRAKGYA
ncbi:MAG TPA: lysylphosphatidylglycerol synthase transmembrane domain-containing protein, partial [Acidimicrobiia bacterium]|nr:lysylphosphatidylglycerol synthase transmembrane domain-containing protein [Acidimicrobiia bacterium]